MQGFQLYAIILCNGINDAELISFECETFIFTKKITNGKKSADKKKSSVEMCRTRLQAWPCVKYTFTAMC